MSDRPAIEPIEEIELTPEMIDVGVKELQLSFSSDGRMDSPSAVVSDIFAAMLQAASPRRKAVGHRKTCTTRT